MFISSRRALLLAAAGSAALAPAAEARPIDTPYVHSEPTTRPAPAEPADDGIDWGAAGGAIAIAIVAGGTARLVVRRRSPRVTAAR